MKKEKVKETEKKGFYIVRAHDKKSFSDVGDARRYAIKLLECGCFFIILEREK